VSPVALTGVASTACTFVCVRDLDTPRAQPQLEPQDTARCNIGQHHACNRRSAQNCRSCWKSRTNISVLLKTGLQALAGSNTHRAAHSHSSKQTPTLMHCKLQRSGCSYACNSAEAPQTRVPTPKQGEQTQLKLCSTMLDMHNQCQALQD
jgi:hypothetical protein